MNPALESVLTSGPRPRPGEVWLVGAGPGDPALLTLEAARILGEAEVVVYDALVDPRVLDLAPPDAERIFAGKRGGQPSLAQCDITEHLIALARAGRRVVRLKGGDPFVFGRGGEEVFGLAEAGVKVRLAAGLTSGLAALTAAGVPATLRGINQAIVLVTGHAASDQPGPDWGAMARLGQPIVLYMAMRQLAAITCALIAGGLAPSTPAAIIALATRPGQRVLVSTLGAIAADAERGALSTPAIVVIGGIVAAGGELAALTARGDQP
jgi:uroporphyrin-III C-methyltransferase